MSRVIIVTAEIFTSERPVLNPEVVSDRKVIGNRKVDDNRGVGDRKVVGDSRDRKVGDKKIDGCVDEGANEVSDRKFIIT